MNDISPSSLHDTFKRRFVLWLQRRVLWLTNHWLAVFNTFFILYTGLPFLAPVLLAAGWHRGADAIYSAYQITCHQFPSRAYFVLGEQVALCHRDIALYGTLALGGIIYHFIRDRLPPLPLRWYVFFMVPMALDAGMDMTSNLLAIGVPMSTLWAVGLIALGIVSFILRTQNYLTWHSYLFFAFGPLALLYLQFVGPHQSNLFLRNLTGLILGVGTVWFAYPQLEDTFREVRQEVTAKLAHASSESA